MEHWCGGVEAVPKRDGGRPREDDGEQYQWTVRFCKGEHSGVPEVGVSVVPYLPFHSLDLELLYLE